MLWSKPFVHYLGKYFKINGAALLQKPDKNTIPVAVAAKRRNTMQIAAKYADIWESSYITPEQFASLNREFEDILAKSFNNDSRNRR